MGGEQAAQVLSQIKRDKLAKVGKTWPDEEQQAFQNTMRNQYETQGNPYYASARLWDDGVIKPADTRKVLGLSLQAALHAPFKPTRFGVFRM